MKTSLTNKQKQTLVELITDYPWRGTKAIEEACVIIGVDPNRASDIFHDGYLSNDLINQHIDTNGDIVDGDKLVDIFVDFYS